MAFNGKVVIVTGASSGIGAAIAIKFAEEGADVVIVGRNETKLKKTHEKCAAYGKNPLTVVADVTKDDDVKRIVNDTVKQFSKIDILINNAGVMKLVEVEDENAIEDFDHVIATNLRSVVLLTNLVSKKIIETKGNIINISSIAAFTIVKNYLAYGTAKAALDHFTKIAALSLASKGVRVNSVNPGPVETDLFGTLGLDINNEQSRKRLEDATALGRISQPEEIADLVLFVASDKAKAITGSIIVSDNGRLLQFGNTSSMFSRPEN